MYVDIKIETREVGRYMDRYLDRTRIYLSI